MTTQEAFVDNADQDQTAQTLQSDLSFTLSTFSIQIITKIVSSSCNGSIVLANEKLRIIYSVVKRQFKCAVDELLWWMLGLAN